MKKQKGKSSRELGLELAAICGAHFFKLEHLHYGYWTLDLDIALPNLHKAQEQYTDFLLHHIPDEVHTILDVGCGTGHIAKKLADKGYKVDCVSPSHFLNERVHALLGDKTHIFECLYERLKTSCKYDLILFSESFQYVNIDKSLKNTAELLNAGGHLLICDFFKVESSNNGAIGGGHKLKKFNDLITHYPFELIKDIDITPQTAPNHDLFDTTMKDVAAPALEASLDYLSNRYRLMAKFLRWKYKKQIERLYTKYFNGKRSAEDFRKYKTYRFFLYKLVPAVRRPVDSAVEGKAYPDFVYADTAESNEESALCCSAP
jgi:SAM-dependent methyltransferase